MRANECNLLNFIKKSPQLTVPIYQRNYSWGRKECLQLWDDIIKAGADEGIHDHFVGSIVYIQKQLFQVTDRDPLLVIDGQQRLTSVILIVAALIEVLDEKKHSNWYNAEQFRNFYLFNPYEDGDMRYKLLLSKIDRQSLKSIVEQKTDPPPNSKRIIENYNLFKEQISRYQQDKHIVFKGLQKLVVVDIALDRNQDNPQLIFESMNSKGQPLCQADLIRNYVLMGLTTENQNRIYEELWYPMEEDFGQEEYSKHFDKFMRYYLTIKDDERQVPKESEVYTTFKTFVGSGNLDSSRVESVVKDIRKFAGHYCKIALKEREGDKVLRAVFNDLRELNVTPVYPFLLEMYDDYHSGKLSKDNLGEIVRLVESYIFRRSVCSIPTNTIKNTFASLTRNLPNEERSIQNIKARILTLRPAERLPDNNEFSNTLKTRDMYNISIKKYWLRRLENFERKEQVLGDDYTIEHIMPQSEQLSSKWISDLGSDWQRIHDQYLHTIGNLTWTGYNSEYSNKPFNIKRDMKGGFRESPLRLNSGLGQVSVWNEKEILKRTEELVSRALKVWQVPVVSPKILEEFSETVKAKQKYSIKDHPKLRSSNMYPFFIEFRNRVFELDPIIKEEYQKNYVTYRLYTNVVDLIPLSAQFKLTLNSSLANLDDPRGMCRDVSNIGRWGNGEVEVRLDQFDKIPYVVNLISQIVSQQLEEYST